MVTQTKVNEWDKSYSNKDNYIFYPHDELIKFVSRYIKKRTGLNEFETKLPPTDGQTLKALDFGCGIGTSVLLLHEFGVEATGVEISEEALKVAREHGSSKNIDAAKFFKQIEPNQNLPFSDQAFDFFISCCVLDSLPFNAAKKNLAELSRVTKKYGYISLISGDFDNFFGETEITTKHEEGTIQSFFNYEKCIELIEESGFKIISCELITNQPIEKGIKPESRGRYHIVLEK